MRSQSLLLRRIAIILLSLSSVDGILLGVLMMMLRVIDARRGVGGSGVLRRRVLHLEVRRRDVMRGSTGRFEIMLNVSSRRDAERGFVAVRVRVVGGALLILELELSDRQSSMGELVVAERMSLLRRLMNGLVDV